MSDDSTDRGAVLISNRQEIPVDEVGLADLAVRCLRGEGAGDSELSLSFVTSDEMAYLHERYMNEPGPTDVLSFRMDNEPVGEEIRVLGDVIIAPSVAAQNNPDLKAELRLLTVHGILHLLGHDHEAQEEKAEMWARQGLYVETSVS